MAPEKKFKIVRGTLIDCARQLDLNTIPHSDETQKMRLDNLVWPTGVLVADGIAYNFEEKTGAVLYISRLPYNLVLNNLELAARQQKETGYFRPDLQEYQAMINAPSTLRIVLSELELKADHGNITGHFCIDPSRPEQTNPARRAIAERVHGSMAVYNDEKCQLTSNYTRVMKMVCEKGMGITEIITLFPEKVKEITKDGPIAFMSYLEDLTNNANFYAREGSYNVTRSCLRGKCPRVVKDETPHVSPS
ncbi:MAG: hypothetical protein Q8O89_02920 [Nanoarchaeota archaeon]|nr:hypothetical protein [Nanoarchaeota archaeon]